jgi:hypothetical protein
VENAAKNALLTCSRRFGRGFAAGRAARARFGRYRDAVGERGRIGAAGNLQPKVAAATDTVVLVVAVE